MTAYLIDTETTGLIDPEPVEVAWVRLTSPLDLNPTAQFEQRYRPSKTIELGALAVHHILDEDLTDCEPSSTFILPGDCDYIIGHNVDYDWTTIGSPPVRRICTLALSRSFWPSLDSHNQSAMLYHLERDKAQQLLHVAHSAMPDVLNCLIILQHIMTAMQGTCQTWEELWRVSELARIPKTAPFGKYRGQPIATIPRAYALWATKQPDFDQYFLKAMKDQCI